ncbi:hypothetical protein MIN45_P0368 [Methylomarinovum tepidoasis]|uniref:Murein endopeptidase K n=2 Tax=Methylomarinovum tepidoasis TaxID=2840183 RepID=A0AAU9C839_9GAMM|nr:hypothetical protein MIN45_P0368 [Methylomarinovum sp. IN45]
MKHSLRSRPNPSRRRFLTGMAAGAVTLAALRPARARSAKPRELAFFHLHTEERLRVEYHDGHRYLPDALGEISHFLRDFRTGEVHAIDPGVLDILHALQQGTASGDRPFHIISAYRSPATNAMLRKRSKGVAKHSYHMQGRAIDIRLPGVALHHLYRAALALKRGGVGLYTQSNFIHVDTGRVRTWGA